MASFSTSYIPTSGSQVTRSADSASMTGDNFSSWYRQDEGTVYTESSTFHNYTGSPYPRIYRFLGDGTRNTIELMSFNNNLYPNIYYNNSSQAVFGESSLDNNKNAIAYAFNNSNGATNGTVSTTDTSCLIPTIHTLEIGSYGYMNGHIKKLSYYPARLTDAEITALTED